jgi:hypothetical protein
MQTYFGINPQEIHDEIANESLLPIVANIAGTVDRMVAQ